ncbi:OsmC family peroxiredoxin [candidate division TA06 bacterium]|uniref:OsmC family peroxiredoxin n=1 Tax=candidate division TA06 bacterium TaxID=2250710 RepID=A0A523UMU1_UNCT6|nr:MAG: OsmC family peroxiredoxin [candidate division TA06 bacterium]
MGGSRDIRYVRAKGETAMGINNVEVSELKKFAEEAEVNPELAKKSKQVEGEWVFDENKPQFRATLAFKEGERIVESDFAPFMGGHGLAPDAVQYCLYGLAACFAGTFVNLAAMERVDLKSLKISVRNQMDLTRTLGLSKNPIVQGVEVVLKVKTDAPREKVEELEALARERCPGVYCLTEPISLKSIIEQEGP